MTARRFLQLDVFAARPGAGNPLAVIPDAEGLDDAAMQAIAAWLDLSETVFLLPPQDGADYRIRIFTPKMELPFAGHPSVGAAWAAVELGLATPVDGLLVQQCAAGLLPVRVQGGGRFRLLHVRSPQAQQREIAAPELPPGLAALAHPAAQPALWNNGPDWWLLELADEAAVRTLRPDQAAIAALPGSGKLAVFARADAGDGADLVVRAFAPGVGIAEDPATGSVNASIAALLHRHGRLPGAGGRYLASQGREIGRGARLELVVDADGGVWVGGEVHAVIRGTVDW